MRFKFDSANAKRVTYFTSKLTSTEKVHKGNLSDYVCTGKNADGTFNGRHDTWDSSFVGTCLEKAKGLANGTQIALKEFAFTNYYSKEKEKNYPSITVFDFDVVAKKPDSDNNGGEPPVNSGAAGVPSDLVEDEGLPFD